MSDVLSLGEPADEAQWRALVEQGLKGAKWERLIGKTADGIPIQPLYRETDIATAADVSGFPGGAPFMRGDRAGRWTILQSYEHPDPTQTNAEILADLAGGVVGIELVLDGGIGIRGAGDLDVALADVILEAAPVSLDRADLASATMLEAKLKGVAAKGTAFNLDPIGALMRTGAFSESDLIDAAGFAARVHGALPTATSLRVDARPVHEAGGAEAQEIGAALAVGIAYLRALTEDDGLSAEDAAATLSFALSVGPDVLIETAKLRALRLCWARVLEASGAAPEARPAHIHAFTSRRMMTRYDAWTNILRVTTAAFAAGIGGADAVTIYPFTDALGLPTAFARRVARNTQNVLLEECRLGHVADPAGGAWFVEQMTRDLAAAAWEVMQLIEGRGGIVAALRAGLLQDLVGGGRAVRQRAIATRRETITGVTDYPLLYAKLPDVAAKRSPFETKHGDCEPLPTIRWAAPFETLRSRAEDYGAPGVFFANLGSLPQFGPRAQFARNLFATGGIGALCDETEFKSRDDMVHALRKSGARAAVICGTDAAYAEEAENAAQRLKASGADWVVLAGRPGESEAKLRAAGVDQFVFAGQDALETLTALHRALGIDA
ncbi:MAG: methylmalonyl-CoA mutase family protein [Vitreimonas sp.]